MTPVEASNKNNEGVVYFNLYGDMETSKQKQKFEIGDKFRISKFIIHQIFSLARDWSKQVT